MAEKAIYRQSDLDAINSRINTKMLNMVDRTVTAMDKLLTALDEVDDAMARQMDIENMNPMQLNGYMLYIKESHRTRQDFLKTLAGFAPDTSKVPIAAEEEVSLDEEKAELLRAEVMRRGGT